MTSVATYAVSQPTRLTAVANVATIPVGGRVSGTGVGHEVYVKSKNMGAGTAQLSQPFWAAAGTQTFPFERCKYALDFSSFAALSRFEATDLAFQCNGLSSALSLPPGGLTFRFARGVVNRPKDRGLTPWEQDTRGSSSKTMALRSSR